MRLIPESSSITMATVILFTFHHLSRGCFQKVEPLVTMSGPWVQATGTHAFVQYEAGRSGDVISVLPRGRDMSRQKTLKCLSLESSSQVLVEIQQPNLSTDKVTTEYQCLRFDVLSKRVLRLSRTGLKSSKNEINCGTDAYVPDSSVLVDASDDLAQPCPLHGSYRATLDNPSDLTRCLARIRFNCHNQNVMVTFGEACKPPVYKYNTNKIRHHSSTQLRCIGDWSLEGGDGDSSESKVLVLRTNDRGSSSSIWCIHYKTVNGSGENFQIHISFDGRCALTDPFIGNKNVFSKDSMSGYLANFVQARDARCSNKFYTNQCKIRSVNCSQTNSCPSQCGRCYTIPKPDTCKFMPETVGSWEVLNSTEAFSVKIYKDSFETSSHGKFTCRYSDETKMFYTNPAVQYDRDNVYCMPLYACMQIFSISPGVSTFYLRQTVTVDDDVSESQELSTCENNNQLFKDHPTPEGEMITLIDESKLKPSSCDFGFRTQFPTSRGYCLLNVEECSGKSCVALNVSYDNETCHDNLPVLPIAPTHQCFASLKFQDGIRGLLTYVDDLEKYFCWIFTSSRLFVTQPKMCNSEAVRRVFVDKHASLKYDPLEAFTVPVIDAPGSSESTVPHLYLLCSCIIFCILCSMKSWL